MKKIAVASKNGEVAKKIEQVSEFTVFYVDDDVIVSNEKICKKVSNSMFFVQLLLDMDINVLIVGRISDEMRTILNNNDVEIVMASDKNVREVTEMYLIGSLDCETSDGNKSLPNVIYQ